MTDSERDLDRHTPMYLYGDDAKRTPAHDEGDRIEGYGDEYEVSVNPNLEPKPATQSTTIIGSLIAISIAVLGLVGSYHDDEKVSAGEISAAIGIILPSANNIKERMKNQRRPVNSLW